MMTDISGRLKSSRWIRQVKSRRVFAVLAMIRLKPFDTSTTQGRSDERLRRVFWTATTSALARGVNVLTMLVSVPITLGYLGAERYGLWMAITSFIAFLGFADLGIGNGLLNVISTASGKDSVETARRYISSSFVILIGTAVFLSIVFALVNPAIAWGRFFNVSSPVARSETGPAMAALLLCVLINLPLSIIPRIQMGYQEGYLSSIWQGGASVLGLGALLIVVRLQAGLPWLVMAIVGSTVVGNLLNGVSLFAVQRPWLMPRWRDVNSRIAAQIALVGVLFLILQLSNAIIYSADNIVIARILGAEAVTHYAVPAKLFTLVPMVLYMFLAPLWPAYGEATARGDDLWAKKMLIKAAWLTFALCTVASAFLLVFGEWILKVWTGSQVAFSVSLMIGLGVWSTLQAMIATLALFLNAINKIGFQAIFSVSAALLSTLAKIWLANRFGLAGVVWGNVIVTGLLMLVPYSLYLKQRFNRHRAPYEASAYE